MPTKTKAKPAPAADPKPVAPAEILAPEEWHALAVAAKPAGKLRDRLSVGPTPIDVTVRIHGTLSVGGDQSNVVEEHPRAELLLGLVLASLGPATRAKALESCREGCRDWLAGGDAPKLAGLAAEAAEDLYAALCRQSEQFKRGSVTGILLVERM